jgi:hypothetical protein
MGGLQSETAAAVNHLDGAEKHMVPVVLVLEESYTKRQVTGGGTARGIPVFCCSGLVLPIRANILHYPSAQRFSFQLFLVSRLG